MCFTRLMFSPGGIGTPPSRYFNASRVQHWNCMMPAAKIGEDRFVSSTFSVLCLCHCETRVYGIHVSCGLSVASVKLWNFRKALTYQLSLVNFKEKCLCVSVVYDLIDFLVSVLSAVWSIYEAVPFTWHTHSILVLFFLWCWELQL